MRDDSEAADPHARGAVGTWRSGPRPCGLAALALAAMVVAVMAWPAPAAGQGAAAATDATVLIRVIGDLRAEFVDGGGRIEEQTAVQVSVGTGFVISPFGYVVTANHVINDAESVEVVLGAQVRVSTEVTRVEVVFRQIPSGSTTATFVASVLTADPELDLALLSIPASGLPYAALGDSDALTVGQRVQALGYPFGGAVDALLGTATPNVAPQISASGGALSGIRDRGDGIASVRLLQTDAVINPGNSGGPLVDDKGHVLGVVQMEVNRDGQPTRLGFAVGVNHVTTMAQRRGLGQFLPTPKLRLGPTQTFEDGRLRVRLPEGVLIGFPDRLAVNAQLEAGGSLLSLRISRVWSPWGPQRLARELVATDAFEDLVLGTLIGPVGRPSANGVAGFADGVDERDDAVEMEYAIVSAVDEHLVARYLGPPELLAFNRSILRTSLDSLEITRRRTTRFEQPQALELLDGPFLLPEGPIVRMPRWVLHAGSPASCGTGTAPRSWIGASPTDDFTVSIRLAWWPTPSFDPATAAAGCGEAAPPDDQSVYRTRATELGVTYVTEGRFLAVPGGGILQVEARSPETVFPAVRQTLASWFAAPTN